MKILVKSNGSMLMICHDDLRNLLKHGKATRRRASHVEPIGEDEWQADLSPIGGPILGPFKTRQKALDKEIKWLEQHLKNL